MPSKATYAARPSGANTRPKGCDALGSVIVRLTLIVDGSITLMVAERRLVTQTSPFGARAIDRGAVPTAISASFWRLEALNTLTVSLSWLTTQRRPPPRARLLETAGRLTGR